MVPSGLRVRGICQRVEPSSRTRVPVMEARKLKAASVQYPKPPELKPSYGTAGFRSEAIYLPCTVFRCTLLG